MGLRSAGPSYKTSTLPLAKFIHGGCGFGTLITPEKIAD